MIHTVEKDIKLDKRDQKCMDGKKALQSEIKTPGQAYWKDTIS